ITAPVSSVPPVVSGVSQNNQQSIMAAQVQIEPTRAVSPRPQVVSSPSKSSPLSSPVTTAQPRPTRIPASTAIKQPVKRGLKVARRGVGTLVAALLLCSLVICGGSYFVYTNFIQPPLAIDATGATALSGNFVQAISNRAYSQAYRDLGPSLTQQETLSGFQQKAQGEDNCYGTITSYKSGSSVVQGKTVQNTYTVKRQKIPTYTLTVTLQQDDGKWGVTNFTSNAGDGQHLSCG
ncbi:MAG: hypothetical protein M3Z24_11245, partial [Chloroflexota bacterium]|nr:hypothetical protein [Chloroflexota bacterium]